MNVKLAKIHDLIEMKCIELGFNDYSWCDFLYSPENTFSPEPALWFIGLNPNKGDASGDGKCKIKLKLRNAFYADKWGVNKPNALQQQVKALFEKLDEERGGNNYKALMDETLTANFFPFATKGWDDPHVNLRQWELGIAFSWELWNKVMDLFIPKVIVTLTTHVADRFNEMLQVRDWIPDKNPVNKATGWGNVQSRVHRLHNGDRKILIIGFPHLSQYKIFSSKNCNDHVAEMVTLITQSL